MSLTGLGQRKRHRVQTTFPPALYKMLTELERITGEEQSEILRAAFVDYAAEKASLIEAFKAVV